MKKTWKCPKCGFVVSEMEYVQARRTSRCRLCRQAPMSKFIEVHAKERKDEDLEV